MDTVLNGHDDLEKRCRKQSCTTYEALKGDWGVLKSLSGRVLAYFNMNYPKDGKKKIIPARKVVAACPTRASRLGAHGMTIWKQLLESGMWKR